MQARKLFHRGTNAEIKKPREGNKMREYAFDAVVFLHRAQPFHKAHKKIYDRALALGKLVIPVFGSDLQAVNTYNPWKSFERKEMCKSCFDEEDLARVRFTSASDHPYQDEAWLAEVHTKVRDILEKECENYEDLKIGIIGYKKDSTSAYLNWFPQWEFIDTASFSRGISATDIRNSYFVEMLDFSGVKEKYLASKTFKEAREKASSYSWREHLPPTVVAFLERFKEDEAARCASLVSEHLSNLKKKADKEAYCYPIIENTVDNVVMKSAHILLVKRGVNPGIGQWALPGGYLNEFEEQFDAALRELKEETKLNLFRKANLNVQDQYEETRKELVKCFVGEHTFSYPLRSTRGRVITTAFHFQLPVEGDFPYIKGADDATEAKWFSIADIFRMREQMFEDHFSIIQFFTMGGKK